MGNPQLFEFSDFRSFLKAHASDKREQNRRWSYGLWARQLKLKGTASLTMVLNGQRKPGPKMVDRMIQYFQFNNSERIYFRGLVELDRYKEDSTRMLQILDSLKSKVPHQRLKILGVDHFNYISHWYNFAIRQMAELPDFQPKAKWIKNRLNFPVREYEINGAIANMLELGLLEKTKKGVLRKTQENIDVVSEVASSAIKRYHCQVMALAKDSLIKDPMAVREMSALTFAVDSKKLDNARRLIEKFKDEMRELGDEGEPNSVYQLNIQLYPLTTQDELIGKGDER